MDRTSRKRKPKHTRNALIVLISVVCVASFSACHNFPFPLLWNPNPKIVENPLPEARMSSNSIVLDIYSVQMMPGDRAEYAQMWQWIDEQQIPASTRRALDRQGFRAGVVGSQIPGDLANFLQLEDKPAPTGSLMQTRQPSGMADPETPQHRHLQVPPGEKRTITTSSLMPELSLLQRDPQGRVSGKTLTEAQTLFEFETEAQYGGHVSVQLVPIITHGEAVGQFSGDQGEIVYEMRKRREVFEAITMEATLSPGRMLLIGPTVDCTGTLAEHFFCDSDDATNTGKFFLIRLIQTQQDELFHVDPQWEE